MRNMAVNRDRWTGQGFQKHIVELQNRGRRKSVFYNRLPTGLYQPRIWLMVRSSSSFRNSPL